MMPTKQQDNQEKQEKARRSEERHLLNAVIGKQVMHTLGQPDELRGVQVRPLWDDHYRVNVLVGPDAASVKVAHSYFLVADGQGNVVTSTPSITKQY
jgi:hypothetical protein